MLFRSGADLLVLVTDVDALYAAPPSQSGAKRILEVRNIDELTAEVGGAGSRVGSGGMITKIEAARISTGAGIPLLLTSLQEISQSLSGSETGTLFVAQQNKKSSRLLWLAHAATPRGRLILDQGAVTALMERGVSLLPAGVTGVTGDFRAGDTVEIVAPTGNVIARGLVAFDSEEIPQMLGRSTKDIAKELGAEYEQIGRAHV